jgi:hypothetical protein
VAETPKAAKPPYTSVSDVDAFFDRVQTIAEPKPPKKVDSGWVGSYGFETAHPSAIPSMLRWLGVVDESFESTGVWNDLRVDGTRQTTLARLVREAYKPIFDAVEVDQASTRDLRGAFVSAYEIGDPGRHIKCFLALCKQAGVATAEEAVAREREAKPKQPSEPKKPAKKATAANAPSARRQSTANRGRKLVARETSGVSVTLNVEIPAEWSEDEIRARIAAVTRALEPADSGDS